MKTILAPIDFSGITDSVVDQASVLARALDGRVVLLNVLQPPVITSEYGPFLENISEIILVGEKATAKQLAAVQERLTKLGIETETLQFTGASAVDLTSTRTIFIGNSNGTIDVTGAGALTVSGR